MNNLFEKLESNIIFCSDNGFYIELRDSLDDKRVEKFEINRDQSNTYIVIVKMFNYSYHDALSLCKEIFLFMMFSSFSTCATEIDESNRTIFDFFTVSQSCAYKVKIICS